MRFDSLIVFILISIFCSDSFGLSLYAWSPSGHSNTFVIGVRESESPEQAARRYIELALTEPALKSLIQGDLLGHMRIDGLRPLSQSDFKERALIIANRPTDLRSEDERVESFVRIFKNTNTQSYIVPFAADLGLDQKESQELIQLLDQNFSAFVAMGGADVDIRMWNQSLHESSVVNTRRDQFEKSLIEEKVNTIRLDQSPSFRKDRLLGVCRGAQFVARVMGYELGVDVAGHGGQFVHDLGGESKEPAHLIEIRETKNSFLKKLVNGLSQITVNSYHHQYVNFKEGGELQLAAVSPDGVPEAFESLDGSILLLQFHPELMAVRSQGELRLLGEKIMNGVIDFLTPLREPQTCSALLE